MAATLVAALAMWGAPALCVEFTSNTTISSADYVGEPIIVTGCNLTVNCAGGPAHWASLLVRSNGMVTHTALGANGLWLEIAGDATIERGSGVAANARGYAAQTGPGGATSGGGASHGGVGGYGGAPVYGSFTEPGQFGSGGGNTPNSGGGAGGGRIRLTVGGTLTVAGGLSADGAVTCGGGGAGGAIHVEAGSITGGGRIGADGSSCTSAIYTHGGGGGGRIALYYDTWSFTGAVSAAGGPGSWSVLENNGGPGTVYRKQSGAPPTLTFDNGSTPAWTTHPAPVEPDATLTVRATSVRLDCTAGPVQVGGLLLTDSSVISGMPGSAAGLQVEAAGDITVEANSKVIVSGQGYPAGAGPGAGSAGSGGSHGGRGGAGGTEPSGRETLPDTMGSGGGATAGGVGGAGGGMARLAARGTVRVDGAVQADGLETAHGGGGAGGSVRIVAGSIVGSGSITALGAAANSGTYSPGGGGGGRIGLYVPAGQASFPAGTVAVGGGSGTGSAGDPGTLHRAEVSLGPDAAFLADECSVEQQGDGSWVAHLAFADLGLVEASELRVELFDRDPAAPGAVSLGHTIVARLGPACAANAAIAAGASSTGTIWAVLDPLDTIAEGREDNNVLVFVIGAMATSLYVPDRSGTITEVVILRAYLKQIADGAPVPDKPVSFDVDGSAVGQGITGPTGRADLSYVVPDGPPVRSLSAAFGGDATYGPSSGTASLACATHATKMAGANREGKITAYRVLKVWLWRMDNSPVVGKSIAFKLDGTLLGSDDTRTTGLAQIGYTIVAGAGAGTRTILAEWAGDGGYLTSSCTNTLTVLKATPYIWVMPRSVPSGGIARFYAYFRRLADYQKQVGKTVSFTLDGTWIVDVVTGAGADAGIARYNYTTVEPPGAHTIRCEFAGDAWVDAGYGEGNLTIY